MTIGVARGVGVVSLMFLSVGSEPVRSGGTAEGCLFETARPQLAWPGEDAADTDHPPGSYLRFWVE